MVLRLFRTPVARFNMLVPKDRGAALVARGAAFGPHERQRLDLYAPKRRGDAPLPVLVFFYGGSWASGIREGYGFAGRAFASQGFLTAIPDYRLVPEVRFPGFVEDAATAVRRVRELAPDYRGDPDRIVIAGHSAGAYIAAMLALDPQWLGEDRKFVRGFAGMAGPYDFLPLSGESTMAAFGQAADLRATQPVTFASPDSPPSLLLHGKEDRTVSPRNSRALAARLNEAGAKAETIVYPAIGHVAILTALALPFRRRAPVLADITEFARNVTQPGRAEPGEED